MRGLAVATSLSSVVRRYFVLYILLAIGIAVLTPSTFAWIADYASPLLGLIMLGMGLTLTLEDFRLILEQPRDVFLGASTQWLVMPAAAYGLTVTLSLPPEVGVGLLLLGAAPGGVASNVYTYLAKGDVALSVTITSVTTLAAPVLMPAWIIFLVGERIQVTFAEMFREIILIVALPIVVGLTLRRLLERRAPTAAAVSLEVFPAVSVLTLAVLVAGLVGAFLETLLAVGVLLVLAVLIHNLIGLSAGYATGSAFGMSTGRARACSFELGTQNSALALVIGATFFSSGAVVAPIIAVVLHQLTGPALATYFAGREESLEGSVAAVEH